MSSDIPNIVLSQEYSIQYTRLAGDDYSESEPLLHTRRTNANWLFIIFLFSLLCCGVVVGIYLLVEEQEWDNRDDSYTEILEVDLNTGLNYSTLSRFQFPLRKILLTEIRGPPCYNSESCIKQVREKDNIADQLKQNVMYNFLINKDGEIFEDLGWNLHHVDCDNNTLNIAILDNFDVFNEQAIELADLMDFGISSSKLFRCPSFSYISNSNGTDAILFEFTKKLQNEINFKYRC